VWYPVGGFHRVVEALVDIGKRFGAEYRLATGVEAILLDQDGSRAKGVRLENGEVLEADIVVNNSDLVYAYNELLPKSSYADSLSQRPGSCSSISFYWALSEKVPALQPHNIFLADDYRESFDSIFKKQLIPDEPSFYVNVPSRIDPSAAPPDGDSVVVLVPVGHLVETASNGKPAPQNTNGPATTIASASPKNATGISPTETQDWPAMIALARKTILSTIKSRTGADLAPLIAHELTNDPMSWRDRFNLDKGAILGLSHSFFNVLSFRPSTRARKPHWIDGKLGGGVVERIASVVIDTVRGKGKDVRGLYMVGASAHPGTGVPIVLAGGRLVAEQILEDLGMERPWGDEERRVRNVRLDTVEKPFWLDDSRSWGAVVVMLMVVLWGVVWVRM
jgi:phytoene desaturase (3,4-didehydrolycopene-forming)